MARVIFKRPVLFEGRNYPANKERKIPDNLLEHWFIKDLLKAGLCEIIEGAAVAVPSVAMEPAADPAPAPIVEKPAVTKKPATKKPAGKRPAAKK